MSNSRFSRVYSARSQLHLPSAGSDLSTDDEEDPFDTPLSQTDDIVATDSDSDESDDLHAPPLRTRSIFGSPLPTITSFGRTPQSPPVDRTQESDDDGVLKKDGNFDLLQQFKLENTEITLQLWRSRITGFKFLHADVEKSGCETDQCVILRFLLPTSNYSINPPLRAMAQLMPWNTSSFAEAKNILTSVFWRRLQTNSTGRIPSTQSTLTDAAFTTEVFHIDGEGHEGGAVMDEMRKNEREAGDIINLKALRSLYNKENGNRMIDYHVSTYVPQNLTCMVFGNQADPSVILKALNTEIEPSLIREGYNQGAHPEGWCRPFLETSTAFNPPVIHEDKKWVGPSWHELLTISAITLLGDYLMDSENSPFQKAFVKGKVRWCSSIKFDMEANPRILSIDLDSVPTSQLDSVAEKLEKTLDEVAKKGIDMRRLRSEVESSRRCMVEDLKAMPVEYFHLNLRHHNLYGADDGSDLQLEAAFADPKYYRLLSQWDESQWHSLLLKYFMNPCKLTIIGRPSASLIKENVTLDRNLVTSNVARYGKQALKTFETELKAALREKAKPVPESLLEPFRTAAEEK
ncbi:hypothetical protein T439DRAFT_336732 [Meredithblackwellia eburnea MCA 4105]